MVYLKSDLKNMSHHQLVQIMVELGFEDEIANFWGWVALEPESRLVAEILDFQAKLGVNRDRI